MNRTIAKKEEQTKQCDFVCVCARACVHVSSTAIESTLLPYHLPLPVLPVFFLPTDNEYDIIACVMFVLYLRFGAVAVIYIISTYMNIHIYVLSEWQCTHTHNCVNY